MNTVIDIYNRVLFYDKTEINYIIDNDERIWFNFINIAKILEYKSTKDVILNLECYSKFGIILISKQIVDLF